MGKTVELLIGGHDADHPIACRNKRAEHVVIGSRRTVGEHYLLGLHGLIQRADAAAQSITAHNIAIGQPLAAEVRQKLRLVLARHGKQQDWIIGSAASM